MVHQDEPNKLASSGDGGGGDGRGGYSLEIPAAHDYGESAIAPQPKQSAGNSLRGKVLMVLACLALLFIGGRELHSYGVSQAAGVRPQTSRALPNAMNKPKKSKALPHAPLHKPKKSEALPHAPLHKPKQSEALSQSSTSECHDDPNFVFPNLKTCETWLSHVGRKPLLNNRCQSGTAIYDDHGDELQAKHFCRKSCGMCGDTTDDTATQYQPPIGNETPENALLNPYVEELKEIKNEEEEKFAEELEEIEENGEGAVEEIEKEKEENMTEEEKEQLEMKEEEEMEVEEIEDEKLWEVVEEEENEIEEEEEVEGIVEKTEDEEGNIVVKEIDHDGEGGEFVSEGTIHEPPSEVSTPRGRPPPSDVEEFAPVDDYFIPLTALEREALKEKLRGTLRDTKNALIMASTLHGERGVMIIPHQRTLTLDVHSPKQFMHLQHNQAGSESIDGLITCAVDRQTELHPEEVIVSQSIGEGTNLNSCLNELATDLGATLKDGEFYLKPEQGSPQSFAFDPGNEKLNIPKDQLNACETNDANVMSYSAALNAVRAFGWKDVDSIAMFANPMERVHRIYRLTAALCYNCRELKDVLGEIEKGTFGRDDNDDTNYDYNDSCAVQMIGHQGTNLLSDLKLFNVANDASFPNEKEIVKEAIRNLREEITWIGLLDEMEDSVNGFQQIFPWLAVNLSSEAKRQAEDFAKTNERIGDDVNFGMPVDYIDESSCVVEEEDEPKYICGSKEIDEETSDLIKRLNTRDLAVYKAATERFLLQKEVIAEYQDAIHEGA